MKSKNPSLRSIKEMRRLSENLRGSHTLPHSATKLDHEKYKLCREFVIYLNAHDLTQLELAKKLKITRTRVTEIVNYNIKRISLDTLFCLLGKINKKAELKVAYIRKNGIKLPPN